MRRNPIESVVDAALPVIAEAALTWSQLPDEIAQAGTHPATAAIVLRCGAAMVTGKPVDLGATGAAQNDPF